MNIATKSEYEIIMMMLQYNSLNLQRFLYYFLRTQTNNLLLCRGAVGYAGECQTMFCAEVTDAMKVTQGKFKEISTPLNFSLSIFPDL